MRPGVILPEISKRKPNRDSDISDNKKDELIKAFQLKLRIHQQEIDKNNGVIQSMTNNFDIIRSELMKEKAYSEELSTSNKKLREDIERYTKSSRGSKSKLDQFERLYAKQLEITQELQSKLTRYKQRESKDQHQKSYEQKRNKKLQQDNFNLTKANSQLSKEIENLKQSYKDKLDDQDSVSKVIEKYLEEMKELKEERNRLKSQNEMYEGRLVKVNGDFEQRMGRLEEENKRLKSENKAVSVGAQEEKSKNEGMIIELKQQLSSLESSSSRTIRQLTDENKQCQQKNKQLQNEAKTMKEQQRRDDEDQRMGAEKVRVKLQKLEDLMKLSTKIDQGQKLLIDNLQCQFCKNILKQPVTIIPCGHCFCLGCKKGYQKECCSCGPKVKIDALYRNQLLDDVLAIYNVVREIKTLLK